MPAAKTGVASQAAKAAGGLQRSIPTRRGSASSCPQVAAILRLQHAVGNQSTLAVLRATATQTAPGNKKPEPTSPAAASPHEIAAAKIAHQLGLPAGAFAVRTDDEARRRTRTHRTRGWAEQSVVYLDPDRFDIETRDGLGLLGHELTHLAQARLPLDGREATAFEAEAEAREIGAQLAAGGAPRHPRLAYRHAAAEEPKAKKPENTLPPGQDIGFLSNGDIVFRSSWWGVDRSNPKRMMEMLYAMKAAQYFWWMTPEQMLLIASKFSISEKYDPKAEFTTVYWAPDILQVIGPPPGSDFMFQRLSGGGIQVVIRSSAIGKIPAIDPVQVKISKAQYISLFDAMDKYTGVVSADSDRAGFLALPVELTLMASPYAGSLMKFPKENLDALYEPERYRIFLEKKSPGADQPKPVKKFQTGGGLSISFDAAVSNTDMEYAAKWLNTIRGPAPSSPTGGPQIAGKTYYQFEIDLMREIDKNPQQAEILAKLRSYSGTVDWSAMRWAVNQVEYETAAKTFGVPVRPDGGRRVFPEPVAGEIRVEGLAYPGRTTRIWFKKSNPQSAFLFEIIKTQWVVERIKTDKSREKIAGPTQTTEINARAPDYFSFPFPEIGIFRVNAFVDHNWYFPRWFTEDVEVKTENERLAQVKGVAYAGMGEAKVTNENKDFDTSLFNEALGPQKFDKGKELQGTLPADWARLSDADRLKFIADDKKNLNALVAQYDTKNASYSQRDIVSYAKARLESLGEQETKISDQQKGGYVFFEARGAYLSRAEGVADSPLKLVGMSHGDPDKVIVRLHDFTRLFGPEDYTFEGEGKSFDQAAEDAFLKLCKRYPKGRMSVLFERMNNGNQSYRQIGVKPETIGWELDTNTAWKAVRSVVWDPAVTIVVNLAGAALIIFAPPTAAIVLPVLAAYNSIETVSRMSDLESSGNLTKGAFAKGVAEIGLNVLPVIAEFKAIGMAAKVASEGAQAVSTADRVVLYGLQGVTVAGMLVLMTAEGVEQCKKLQEQDVSEVARLLAILTDVRKRNPNHPDIPRLEAELQAASTRALNRSAEAFQNMAQSLAILLVPTAAMAQGSKFLVGKNVTQLIAEGRFVHQADVVPHYDPIEGVMKGDTAKVTRQNLDGLKAQYATDQGIKQAQLEQIVGNEKVELKYDKQAKAVTVSTDSSSGQTTIVAPKGTPFEKVVKDAWDNHFSKQPGASAEMPQLGAGKLEVTTNAKVIASKPGVVVGRGIDRLSEAEALLRRIGDGDKTAFGELGTEIPGRTFDPQKVEWGLGQTADGKYVIIRGQEEHIDWAKTPGVTPVSHTHQMAQSRLLSGSKITFADLVKGAGENAANADKVMPSPTDIKFMVENGLSKHTVETPYVSEGNGVVGNPGGNANAPKISIDIVMPERAGSWKNLADVPVYRAKLRARAGGDVIWEADVWATHNPESGSQLMFAEPSPDVMTKPVPGTPVAPGTGAQFSGSHNFSPANDVQTRALNDWKKLQSSPTKYTGKFTWEDWLYRYEKEGLSYDVEGKTRRWKSADGKPKEVEMFGADAKGADVVKRLTTEAAGPTGATSTFKPFFETLKRRGLIKDAAELETLIEKEFSFKDRSVDYVRHKLKERFKPQLMEQASPKRWDAAKLQEMQQKYPDLPWVKEPMKAKEAAGHREISDICNNLDSADKGPMLEQWLQENAFPDAKSQIAANKGDVDAQLKAGQTLGDNRKLDLLDQETAIESKTVNDKLSADEASLDVSRKPTSQLLDYLRMVGSEIKLTVKGQIVQLKKLKYVFTTTTGAQKNLDTIKAVLQLPEYKGKVSFDVYDPTGVRLTIRDLGDLAKPEFAWLQK